MENRERYKRIIMFLSSVVIVAIETALFAYIWYNFYLSKEVIGRLFVSDRFVCADAVFLL